MVRSFFFTENLWHTFLFSLHPSLCYYYVSAHKDNVNIGIFFNQIRNCILRTTLCASGAKTNNRCLSVCMFLIACVCPGLPLWHLTKPLIRITSARLVWEWGSGASHWTEENTAGIRDSLLCQTHIQRHTRTSAQRKEHTHSHTQKWLKF